MSNNRKIRNRYKRRMRNRRKQIIKQAIYVVMVLAMLAGIIVLGAKLFSMLSEYKLFGDSISSNGYVTLPGQQVVTEETMQLEDTARTEGPESEPQVRNIDPSPTSIHLEWANTSSAGYVVKYQLVTNSNGEHHGKTYTTQGNMVLSEICTANFEGSDDQGIEDPSHGWICKETVAPEINITGLEYDQTYKIHITYKEDGASYSDAFEVTTDTTGYCDPFQSIDSFLTVSDRDSSGAVIMRGETVCVVASSPDGCKGAEAKPIIAADLFSDPDMTNKTSDVVAGTSLTIMDDESGHHCYLTSSGQWAVFVADENGVGGWINARTLLVDIKKLYDADNYIYGIQINRTNASGSIFTAGGNAHAVNTTSAPETRFDSISVNDANYYLNVDGYNQIDNITGQVLPNYGSPYQMPVIWDLALELKQCQKTALENGYQLLMYEGYRPASTSLLVSSQLSTQGYLSLPVYNTNLAQGFLVGGPYNVSYYIAQQSRHNRGIATDLTLMKFNSPTELGDEITVQTKMHTLDYRCNMQYNTWDADLLTDIMIGHGSHLEYLTVQSEWWHFQLKKERTDLYPLLNSYPYSDIVF